MEEKHKDIHVVQRRPPDRKPPRTSANTGRTPQMRPPQRAQGDRRQAPRSQRGQTGTPVRTSQRVTAAHARGKRAHRRKKMRFQPAGCFLSCALLFVLSGMLISLFSGRGDAIEAAVPRAEPGSDTQAAQSAGPPYVIVIDAGHGGIDLGSDSGIVTEVEMVEDTTDALVSLLERDGNFTPVRTRQTGEGMSIADRAAVANDNDAALFLSIHGNYDETLTASGFECYAQTPGRATHEESLRFANAIVKAMREAGAEIRGQSGVRYAYYEDNQDGTYDKVIAEASDTTVRSEVTFGVLEKNERPAVLVEQCFLSDAADCATWASQEGCEKAARAYYQAICAYFDLQPTALNS